jgi:hypothetical protein
VGSFLSTEDLATAYRDFLKANDLDAAVDEQELVGRVKALAGVKRVQRGAGDKRKRGIVGRKLTA